MTVVFTSYQTATRRLMQRHDRPFRFRDDIDDQQRQEIMSHSFSSRRSPTTPGAGRKRYAPPSSRPQYIDSQFVDTDLICFYGDGDDDDDGSGAHGVLVEYRLKGGPFGTKRHWASIICDESQIIKRREGSMFNFVLRERSDAVHLVTATPMAHSVRDLVNVLRLVWHRMGLEG